MLAVAVHDCRFPFVLAVKLFTPLVYASVWTLAANIEPTLDAQSINLPRWAAGQFHRSLRRRRVSGPARWTDHIAVRSECSPAAYDSHHAVFSRIIVKSKRMFGRCSISNPDGVTSYRSMTYSVLYVASSELRINVSPSQSS